VTAFWEANLHGEYANAVARALEQMDQRAEFQARTQGDLIVYFSSRELAAATSPAAPASTADSGAVPAPSSEAPSTVAPSSALSSAEPTSQMSGSPPPQSARVRGGWLRRVFDSRS
jgi:hypothetical protein